MINKGCMIKDWVCVYSSPYIHHIEIVKAILQDNGITAVVYNLHDSMYQFGDYEIRVPVSQVLEAKSLINQNNL